MQDRRNQSGRSGNFKGQHWTGAEADFVDDRQVTVEQKAKRNQQRGEGVGAGQIEAEQQNRRLLTHLLVSGHAQGDVEQHAQRTGQQQRRTQVAVQCFGQFLAVVVAVAEQTGGQVGVAVVHGGQTGDELVGSGPSGEMKAGGRQSLKPLDRRLIAIRSIANLIIRFATISNNSNFEKLDPNPL